jgi:hypothetical protein
MNVWHIVNISVSVLCMFIWTVWVLRNKDKWRFVVAPLSYLVHVVLFYISAASHLLQPIALNTWSNGVRLHGLILVGAIGVALVCAERCRLWNQRK